MIYQCRCGKIKSGQPHKASGVRDWVCNACAEELERKSNKLERIRKDLTLKKRG
jgi:hypothetical protein